MPKRRQALRRGLQGRLVFQVGSREDGDSRGAGGGEQGQPSALAQGKSRSGDELPLNITNLVSLRDGDDAKLTVAVVAQMSAQTVQLRRLPDTPCCTARINKLPQIQSSH